MARSPEKYLKILKEEKVTVLNQTPAAFYNLMDEELKHQENQLHIRYVIFGGETLKPAKLKQWKEKYPGTMLINMFGITETTVHVTYKEIGEREIDSGLSNIGKPLPNVSVYVMDNHQRVLPAGVSGELYIGGEGVGRGYLNRNQLTIGKFVENPYKPGERLYRSGDLARLLANGDLEYLGRIDHQVKIRGFRIEPGEIESKLLMHKEIKEAVVLEKMKNHEDKYLCAYIVADREIPVMESREYLSAQLPDYMIPAYFVHMEKIPLTSNGKIDRKKLPDPLYQRPRIGTDYLEPRTQLEKTIAEIWAEVLSLDKVGVNDNFFDLGGNSLSLVQVSTKLTDIYGKEIPILILFQFPTIHGLVQYLEQQQVETKDISDKSPEDNKITQSIETLEQDRDKMEQTIQLFRGLPNE
jgi:acyl-CoA synthetase (AMP-forming)/AMP-acid ligase II/acyl carrier protein